MAEAADDGLEEKWKRKARELLPELEGEIDDAETPYALWIEIHLRFEDAYRPPGNDDFIRRAYKYGWWCLNGEDENEEATAAVACFYEELPTHRRVREDLPRWFKREEFDGLRELFRYHLTEGEYEALVKDFHRAKGG